ncbi:lyase family protein [Rhodoferax bucti]|uniref:lyase family protein n=1 Tax=Rhodoferax bucti TaxID=2576305 RepID=UPI001108BFDD|nr:lyase family protein [Rhodoferax bucti]
MSSVFDDFLYPPEVLESFGAQRFVAAMLRVEAALAQAQADAGVIPADAARSIVGTCKAELFDAPRIVRDSASSGSLADPLVKSLQDTVGLFNPAAVPYVHFRITRQDLVDTTMALMTRQVVAQTRHYVQSCITPLQAPLRLAHAAALQRALQRLELSTGQALAVQLGGMRAQLPEHGPAVQDRVAALLGLAVPPDAWDIQRDTWVALGCDIALLTGSLGTLASALVREAGAADPPASCLMALAMARRAPQRLAGLLGSMPHAHTRGLGVWQADQSDWTQLLMSAHASAWGLAQTLLKK